MNSTPKKISEFFPSLTKPDEINIQEEAINTINPIINSMYNARGSIDEGEESEVVRRNKSISYSESISKVKKVLLIPKFLPTNSSYLKKERAALATYLYLKYLSTSGCTPLNKASAAACFVSLPTFHKNVKLLLKMDLIELKDKKIYCRSWSKLQSIFLLPKRISFYYLKYDKNIKHRLIFLAGKESIKAQLRAIRVKKSKTIIHAKTSNSALLNDMKNDFRSVKFSTFTNCKINPLATLSRMGIAKQVGAKHHTTGTYYARMFVNKGWLIDEPGEIVVSYVRSRSSLLTNPESVKWNNKSKKTFMRIPNKLSFLPHV